MYADDTHYPKCSDVDCFFMLFYAFGIFDFHKIMRFNRVLPYQYPTVEKNINNVLHAQAKFY